MSLNCPKHLVRDKIYPIDTIINHWKKNTLGGKRVHRSSKKMKVFKEHGTDCIYCGVKGSFFAVERHKKGARKTEWHLNLYAKLPTGGARLMTMDHVKPKSKGGSNQVNNLRPACEYCNTRKGSLPLKKWMNGKTRKLIKYPKRAIDWKRLFEWDGWKRRLKYIWYTRKFPAVPTKRLWIPALKER